MGRMKIHTILFVAIGMILVLALGINTTLNIGEARHDYKDVLQWRSQELAERVADGAITIIQRANATPDMLRELSGVCETLYNANTEKHVTHVAVILPDGRIIAHSDPEMVDTTIKSQALVKQLETESPATVLDNAVYHTLVPIVTPQQQNYVGSVDIGFPKQALEAGAAKAWSRFIVICLLALGATLATLVFLLQAIILRPIRNLTALGEHLAEGTFIDGRDMPGAGAEIVRLGAVLSRISDYLQHLLEVTARMADGMLDGNVKVRSERDAMGQALQNLQQYLSTVSEMATRFSAGDLSETLQARSEEDGIGKAMQTMSNGLRSRIIAVQRNVEAIADTGMGISDLAEEDIQLAERVHTVTDNMMSTMQDMGASVEEVAHNMNTLSSSVQDTSDSVLMITASITHIAGNASDLTKGSHQTIEAMEGAMESLESVVRSTDISEQLSQETIQDALAGQEAFDHVMSSMELIEETIATSVKVITQFERRSQDIDTILDVIREITEQTGLLALNASIIAAQAGAHGKSFGVVAEEIKELAQGVGASTKDIASILSTLQKDTRMVVKTIHRGADSVREGTNRMQDAQHTLGKIIQSARRSSNVVSEIAEALRKVMMTSRNVVTAMEEVNEMTYDFTIATNEQEMSTEQINNAVTQINTMASQIRQVTDKQLTGVHQMLNAANNVTALLDQNLESSQQLADVTELLASQAAQLIRSADQFRFGAESRVALPDAEHEEVM